MATRASVKAAAYPLRKFPVEEIPGQEKASERRTSHRPEFYYGPWLLRGRRSRLGLGLVFLGSSHTRLSLHLGFVNGGALFQLPAAHVAFGHEVEVGRLALGSALTRLDASSIDLGRPIRGQVVLDVHGTLRTQSLLADDFLLVGVAHDVQL